MIISIIGPPASGKTMLCQRMCNRYSMHYVPEAVDLPSRIVENLNNNTRFLETQIWFRNAMVHNILRAKHLSSRGEDVLMDTCWNVFPLYTECEGRDDFEKEILIEMAEIDKFILPPVDLIVGLKCSRDQLAKHVAKRSADYEQRSESLRRVFTLLDWHTAFYSKTPEVFAVDTEGLDFSCDRDFLLVAERILAEAKLRTTSDGVAGQEHPELQNGPRARGPF